MMGLKAYTNKYLPIAILYFFFNSFLLPLGLLYTTLLTPFFIVWLFKYPSFKYLAVFFGITVPFMIVHFINGVDYMVYFKSYLLFFSVYVFCLTFYQFLLVQSSLDALFWNITVLNICFVVLALFILITPYYDLMWYKNTLTTGVEPTYRLKLLTYEASYYSLLFLPIALFFYLKMLLHQFSGKLIVFFLITIPLVLSLSFGVILGLIFAMVLVFCVEPRLLSRNPKWPVFVAGGLVVVALVIFLLIRFYPDNMVFVRIVNFTRGKDESFNRRTFDAMYLGWKLAEQKSLLFGSGPGQIKLTGIEIFSTYYQSTFTPEQIVIPNNVGDLLAKYGLLGVGIKLFLEVFFFFKTRVHLNYYRFALFCFVFFYQFTGSFITNIAEYVIWLMAFCPVLFPAFNREKIFPLSHKANQPVNKDKVVTD